MFCIALEITQVHLTEGFSIMLVDLFTRNQYGIKINDPQQPMLISRPKKRDRETGEKREELLCLIPELSYMTGLTDEMVANFRVMKVGRRFCHTIILDRRYLMSC